MGQISGRGAQNITTISIFVFAPPTSATIASRECLSSIPYALSQKGNSNIDIDCVTVVRDEIRRGRDWADMVKVWVTGYSPQCMFRWSGTTEGKAGGKGGWNELICSKYFTSLRRRGRGYVPKKTSMCCLWRTMASLTWQLFEYSMTSEHFKKENYHNVLLAQWYSRFHRNFLIMNLCISYWNISSKLPNIQVFYYYLILKQKYGCWGSVFILNDNVIHFCVYNFKCFFVANITFVTFSYLPYDFVLKFITVPFHNRSFETGLYNYCLFFGIQFKDLRLNNPYSLLLVWE